MRRRLRILSAVLLLATGVAALAGCIYIPTFGATTERTNLSRKVGDADSSRPVRKGRATAVDVVRVLGRPEFVSPDGLRVVYTWRQLNGLVIGLCNGTDETKASLTLDFDEAGVLRNYEVGRRRHCDAFDISVARLDYPVPGDVYKGENKSYAEQWRPELVGKAQPWFATTRPTTVPSNRPATRTQAGPAGPERPSGDRERFGRNDELERDERSQ